MDDRDPFEILDVAPDTDWRVVKAAYDMLVEELGSRVNPDDENAALADVEWAYEELKDTERRLVYSQRSRARMIERGEQPDVGDGVGVSFGRSRHSTFLSVLVSTGLFIGMLAAVGYGLYFVGAVRPLDNGSGSAGVPLTLDLTESIEKATEIPPELEAEAVAHTATMEALHATATRAALLDYTSGLTATMDAAIAALTPTPVELRACPNVASVNVRTGPGTGYRAIGYILEGDCVNLTGRNDDADWIVISNAPRPSSDGGWVALSLMTVDGNVVELRLVESE